MSEKVFVPSYWIYNSRLDIIFFSQKAWFYWLQAFSVIIKSNTILRTYFLTCEMYVLSASFYNFLFILNDPKFHFKRFYLFGGGGQREGERESLAGSTLSPKWGLISHDLSHDLNQNQEWDTLGVPGWLSWLSIWLHLRSWSQGSGMEPHVRLPAQASPFPTAALSNK